ncbi:hypothetical protein SBOR_9241 [Sclerotinia borealis F-4128]|uniref:Homeobox domain-containing protein n=1 Tax=Sclerotinia borealis (strain F-4128) TaxID=1432307 RepID=W9C653_SCLBF|nr:hypothetical protein SBOR_9241 [Sclerotinia borealis F-4128]
MPKNSQHAQWLTAYFNQLPNAAVLPQTTQQIANDCNTAIGTTQGIDGVDSQIVGRHISECRRKAANTPRATRMTPGQKQVLDQAYSQSAYPSPGARMIIMHQTNLTYKQVKNWFEQKAKNVKRLRQAQPQGANGSNPQVANRSNRNATQMWKAYNADPAGYVQRLLNGTISLVDGKAIAAPNANAVRNAIALSTINNLNAHLGLGLRRPGATIGADLQYQSGNQPGQYGNQPGQMSGQAQGQQSNILPAQSINSGLNYFGAGFSYAVNEAQHTGQQNRQQAVQPVPDMTYPRVQNAQPGLGDHSDESSADPYSGSMYANYQASIPGHQHAFQSYQMAGEHQQAQQSKSEHSLDDNWGYQVPQDFTPYRQRRLAPFEGQMNNTQLINQQPQTMSKTESASPSGKRKSVGEDEMSSAGHSKKRTRVQRPLRPMPSLEYQKRHGFDITADGIVGGANSSMAAYNGLAYDNGDFSGRQLPPEFPPAFPPNFEGNGRWCKGESATGSDTASNRQVLNAYPEFPNAKDGFKNETNRGSEEPPASVTPRPRYTSPTLQASGTPNVADHQYEYPDPESASSSGRPSPQDTSNVSAGAQDAPASPERATKIPELATSLADIPDLPQDFGNLDDDDYRLARALLAENNGNLGDFDFGISAVDPSPANPSAGSLDDLIDPKLKRFR